jgi:hypothetical protein
MRVEPVAPAPARAPTPVAAPSKAKTGDGVGEKARIQSAVEEAVRPLHQSMVDMQRELEEARRIIREREQATASAASPAPPAAATALAEPVAAPAPRARMVSLPQAPVAMAPVLDVKAIEQDSSIETDFALDGRRRRRRLAVVFAVMLFVVFGGLFALLAQSYAHQR